MVGRDRQVDPPLKGSRAAYARGQASVEFTVLTVILFLALFLIVQLAWFGVQKWQFNHFAAYSARAWSVHQNDSPNKVLVGSLIRALPRWKLYSKDYVKVMWSSGVDSRDLDGAEGPVEGLAYHGLSTAFTLYRPLLGEMALDQVIPTEVTDHLPFTLPKTRLVSYASFIPMRKEPQEEPKRSDRDNDCNETPCESGNGR